MTAPEIAKRKGGAPIVALTAYHAHTARIIDPYVDFLLVGDSLGMVMHGYETTVPVPLDLMIMHAQAVVRGSTRALVVVDMPFGSYEADAKAIAEAGAFAVVIEALAELLAARITKEIPIPTIGIGASAECDGQILVLEDMLGLSPRVPKFVKEYAQIGAGIEAAVKAFATEVRTRAFPTADYTYPMCDEVGEVTKKTKMTGS